MRRVVAEDFRERVGIVLEKDRHGGVREYGRDVKVVTTMRVDENVPEDEPLEPLVCGSILCEYFFCHYLEDIAEIFEVELLGGFGGEGSGRVGVRIATRSARRGAQSGASAKRGVRAALC